MKRRFYGLALAALVVGTAPALALASPLKVYTAGSASQTVFMCPDCDQPIACTRAGDYNIAFSADIDRPRNGGSVRFHVRLTDRAGAPVTNVGAALVLSMVGHGRPPRVLALKSGHGGRYSAVTTFRAVDTQGPWKADVHFRTPRGDVVKQAFTFNR